MLQKMVEAGERRPRGGWTPCWPSTAAIATTIGLPEFAGGVTKAPYDILADTLRGTRGSCSTFRRPEKVLEAVERLVPVAIELGRARPRT